MFGGVQNKEGEYSCVERVGVHGMICHLLVLCAQSLLRCTGLEETKEIFALLLEKAVMPTKERPTWEHLHHRCKNQHLCLFTALYTHVKTHPHTLAFGTDCFILSGTKCLVLLLCQLNRERLFCAHHE